MWQEAAEAAQRHRDESIAKVKPPLSDLPHQLPLDVTGIPMICLTETENAITTLPVEHLYTKIVTERKYSCVEVINAFLRRAALAQKLVSVMMVSWVPKLSS